MKRTAFEGTFTFAGSSLAVLYKEGCLRVVCPVDLAERIIELAERDEGIRASLSWLEGEMKKRPAAKVLLDGVDHQPNPNGVEAGQALLQQPYDYIRFEPTVAPPEPAPFDEHEAPLEHGVEWLSSTYRCDGSYLGIDGRMWRCGGGARHFGNRHGMGSAGTQPKSCFPSGTIELPMTLLQPDATVDVMPELAGDDQFCACARRYFTTADTVYYLKDCPNYCKKGVAQL